MANGATVGVIANPASSRDIRRIVARGPATTTNDKINSLARLMEGLAATGVKNVLSMSDAGGIAAGLAGIAAKASAMHWPNLDFVDQKITHSPDDTINAAKAMQDAGVDAIVVLGGDGTNRLLIGSTGSIPVASISTGTNNAYPRRDEPTVVGFAAGLLATGHIDSAACTYRAKTLTINAGDISLPALVDIAVVTGDRIASGAVWDADSLQEVFLCFAEPDAVGLSSIGGRLQPVSRRNPHGLRIRTDATSPRRVTVPIAPGLVRDLGITAVTALPPGETVAINADSGVISVDGERSLRFTADTPVTVTLQHDGPVVLDVPRAMHEAALPTTTTKGEDTHG